MASRTTAPENALVDRAVLMLTSGLPPESVAHALQEKLGAKAVEAKNAVAKAEKKIILAANYDRTRELGTAIARLNDLYRRATAIQDTKTALSVQRELNKLLDLYTIPTDIPDTDHTDTVQTVALRYLDNLGIGNAETPLAERLRLLAAELIDLRSRAPE